MDSTTQDGHYILVLIKENKVMGYASIYSVKTIPIGFIQYELLQNSYVELDLFIGELCDD